MGAVGRCMGALGIGSTAIRCGCLGFGYVIGRSRRWKDGWGMRSTWEHAVGARCAGGGWLVRAHFKMESPSTQGRPALLAHVDTSPHIPPLIDWFGFPTTPALYERGASLKSSHLYTRSPSHQFLFRTDAFSFQVSLSIGSSGLAVSADRLVLSHDTFPLRRTRDDCFQKSQLMIPSASNPITRSITPSSTIHCIYTPQYRSPLYRF